MLFPENRKKNSEKLNAVSIVFLRLIYRKQFISFAHERSWSQKDSIWVIFGLLNSMHLVKCFEYDGSLRKLGVGFFYRFAATWKSNTKMFTKNCRIKIWQANEWFKSKYKGQNIEAQDLINSMIRLRNEKNFYFAMISDQSFLFHIHHWTYFESGHSCYYRNRATR